MEVEQEGVIRETNVVLGSKERNNAPDGFLFPDTKRRVENKIPKQIAWDCRSLNTRPCMHVDRVHGSFE